MLLLYGSVFKFKTCLKHRLTDYNQTRIHIKTISSVVSLRFYTFRKSNATIFAHTLEKMCQLEAGTIDEIKKNVPHNHMFSQRQN